MDDRTAARDALLARSTTAGLVLAVLTATATGGLTGWLARPEPAVAEPGPAVAEPVLVPRPRRTVYLQVVVRPEAAAPGAGPQQATRRAPAARTPSRAAPRPPAAAPRRAVAPPVARSDGS